MAFAFKQIESGTGLPKAIHAYGEIRNAIITMKLMPGTVLQERDICAQLGISRTPLRDALLRLAREELVSIVPSSGTFVNPVSVTGIIEGHIVRSSLEMRMVRLAARNFDPAQVKEFDLLMFRQQDAGRRADLDDAFEIDNAFHRQICATAGFPRIWQTIQISTGQLDRLRRRAFTMPSLLGEVAEEHDAIYRALRAQDEASAAAAMKAHLDDIARILRFVINAHPGFVTEESERSRLDDLIASGRPVDTSPAGAAERFPAAG